MIPSPNIIPNRYEQMKFQNLWRDRWFSDKKWFCISTCQPFHFFKPEDESGSVPKPVWLPDLRRPRTDLQKMIFFKILKDIFFWWREQIWNQRDGNSFGQKSGEFHSPWGQQPRETVTLSRFKQKSGSFIITYGLSFQFCGILSWCFLNWWSSCCWRSNRIFFVF